MAEKIVLVSGICPTDGCQKSAIGWGHDVDKPGRSKWIEAQLKADHEKGKHHV